MSQKLFIYLIGTCILIIGVWFGTEFAGALIVGDIDRAVAAFTYAAILLPAGAAMLLPYK